MRNNLELTLIEAAKISKNDICVITGTSPQIMEKIIKFLPNKISHVILLIAYHINLGLKIKATKNKDAIIVYSFSTELLLLVFLFSFWTENVYLLIHHNIQQACENPLMNFILKIAHYLKYKFIALEDYSALMDLGYTKQDLTHHTVLPLSVPDNTNNFNKSKLSFDSESMNKKKVGIIGAARSGKRKSVALELVLKVREKLDILLIIGTNDLSCFDDIDLQGIELIDTTTNDSYMAALSACDIVILNYERSRYFHRSSGVVGDAVSVQTYVVCPDFPVMSSQVNYPAKVGVVYRDENDLEIALQEALELANNPDKSVFEMHYAERSIAKTADVINRAIVANSTSDRSIG